MMWTVGGLRQEGGNNELTNDVRHQGGVEGQLSIPFLGTHCTTAQCSAVQSGKTNVQTPPLCGAVRWGAGSAVLCLPCRAALCCPMLTPQYSTA